MKYLVTTLQGHDEESFSDAAVGVYTVEAENEEEAKEKVRTREIELELNCLDPDDEDDQEQIGKINKLGWEAIEYDSQDNIGGVIISTVTLLTEIEEL